MKTRNYYLIFAGIICLFTALLHTIGGQIDLVDPMMNSEIATQTKTELLGAWHMITVLLFVSAFVLLKNAFKPTENQKEVIRLITYLFVLFGVVFIAVGLFNSLLAPQWILLLPIGILSFFGIKKMPEF